MGHRHSEYHLLVCTATRRARIASTKKKKLTRKLAKPKKNGRFSVRAGFGFGFRFGLWLGFGTRPERTRIFFFAKPNPNQSQNFQTETALKILKQIDRKSYSKTAISNISLIDK